ncbi:hypothetical protein ACLOJK_041100 [Asimina triloba]
MLYCDALEGCGTLLNKEASIKKPPYSDFWRNVVVALGDLDPKNKFSVASLEMDLEKNKKKIQVYQHFEFVALVVLHSIMSLMGIALCHFAFG